MSSPETQVENLTLRQRITAAAEPFDHAFSGYGLDIGGRDGTMVPVIRALGIDRVGIVDPDAAALDKAIASGLISHSDAYGQYLTDYVAEGHDQADTAFVFNMQPRLASDIGFLRALGSVVRPQGLVVASFMEPITAHQFSSNIRRQGQLTRMASAPPAESVRQPHAFIHLWRRIS
ncbi:MAG TPA: hypothetical protein VD735_00140 [Candidatus Saccharimonadales bacterium]|nr:hypothetical protein [Candidatus Saccharimonadales bacterium]